MARRISVMIDDDSWRIIERLPRSTRNRAVNAAIREWAGVSMRREASSRMDTLRARLAAVRTCQIVRWIRDERE